MKILVVGGTGMIGGHAALHLQALGHDVSIAGRNPPQQTTALAQLAFLQGDYVAGSFSKADLSPFDAIVFAAGNDIRHGAQRRGSRRPFHCAPMARRLPQFARLAKSAGGATIRPCRQLLSARPRRR